MPIDDKKICQCCNETLSGYLDGELTQQEAQKVALHIKNCKSCQTTFEELEKLKVLVSQKTDPELEIEKIEKIMTDSLSTKTQSISWVLLILAISIGLAFITMEFFSNSEISFIEKLFTSLFWGGILGVFLSVVRQQWLARKNDKYKGVKL